mgnify:CR=1 FL=1|tara:strand:+ start:2554 stop:2721 length:168 start_codon:yes stop_codon:yes gene_type:complete
MSDHKENLTKRAETLQSELQDMSKLFELKKEEFLKVQGALEMLSVLEVENGTDDE